MKYLKKYEIFEDFQPNKMPNSITIKLDGDTFLKWVLRKKDEMRRDVIMDESEIIKSMNYELLKKDGLELINGEYYPLFIWNPQDENPLCVYIMFNGKNTQVDPNYTNFGACISVLVQATHIPSTEFSTFSGPFNKDLQKHLPVDQRIEKANGWNYYTTNFRPGAKFLNYFELVSVNY